MGKEVNPELEALMDLAKHHRYAMTSVLDKARAIDPERVAVFEDQLRFTYLHAGGK